ncbi:DUF3575 domain-containing protein [Paludibacteraceae bacterium OttesenSCG-928-F17]|nr:DUF3575 domain-containing protein [Paludibacteraceae bacterium OttesenSCG-928-F17]
MAADTLMTASDSIYTESVLDLDTTQYSPYIKKVHIYYRVNRIEIEEGYMGNADALSIIDQVFADNLLEKEDFIVITGNASPEGGFNNNQFLARERANSLKKYIRQKYPEIKSDQIITISGGEDWDGLIDMIEKDTNVPARDQLLQILHGNQSREKQKERIRKINGGKPYAYLLAHILPHLRGSVTGTVYFKKGGLFALREAKVDTVEVLRVDTIFIEKEIVRIDTVCPEKQRKPFVMALKSNLIYDIALLPNLAVEFPFGRNYNWSLAIEGNWSWWNTNADSYYFHRIQIAGVELRRWLWNKTGNPLNGWYIGAYGYGGTYDIRLFTNKNTDEGQLSNKTYSAGLTLGYAMPIAKRLNLEFGLGLGYIGGEYQKYTIGTCKECIFPWKSTHERIYWGPTKVNISLVWLIGSVSNKNKEKEEQQ